MPGLGSTAACLLMGRRVLGSPIQWWDSDRTKESCQFHANRYSPESVTKKKEQNTKLICPCYKSTTRKYRTYSSISPSDQLKASRLDKIPCWEFMLREYPKNSVRATRLLKHLWKREPRIGLWPLPR